MDERGEIDRGSGVSQLEAALQFAPVPMAAAEPDGRLLGANRSWFELTRFDPATTECAKWIEGLQPVDQGRLRDALERAVAGEDVSVVDAQLVTESGPRWTRWWLQRRRFGAHELLIIATIDFHDELAQRDDLREQATHDDLTGLVNRRFFVETVDQALRRAERFMEPACVLYVDLDNFKEVNDLAGHATGDRVLRAVADRLKLAVRAADVVARIGGDEFAVLMERLASPEDATVVAERITRILSNSIQVGGRGWPISASVGLALSRAGPDSAAELVARADRSMYATKHTRAQAATSTLPPTATPPPAPTPPDPAAQAPPDPAAYNTVDVRTLQEGMDQLRQSLEALLRDLGADS